MGAIDGPNLLKDLTHFHSDFSIGFVFCCRTNKQTNLQIFIHKL